MKKNIYIFTLILLIFDQITKILVESYLTFPVPIIHSFFSLEKVHNTGAAWGILSDNSIFLVLISGAALILLNRFLYFETKITKTSILGYGLLMGGILGNLIDRLVYGYVIDFLSFTFGTYQFPVFNLADVGIVIGIGILFVEICRGEFYEYRNRRRKY